MLPPGSGSGTAAETATPEAKRRRRRGFDGNGEDDRNAMILNNGMNTKVPAGTLAENPTMRNGSGGGVAPANGSNKIANGKSRSEETYNRRPGGRERRERPHSSPCSRRYAEIGNWKNNRGDGLLGPLLTKSKDPPPTFFSRPELTSDDDDDPDQDIDDDLVDDEEEESPVEVGGSTGRRAGRRAPKRRRPVRERSSSLTSLTDGDVDSGDVDQQTPVEGTKGDSMTLATQLRILDLHDSQGSLSQEPESSGGSTSAESGSDSGWCAVDTPCGISLVERIIRSHPVWFLPGIQRAGAFHLLQGKEEGNFVVRQSSQPATMAISVRLPPHKGPYIEHYLVQAGEGGQLSLESSDNRFASIPQLIAHYSQCCDELPVQLTLPRAIREARNRQQLTSLALLGQEFWRYPMANPRLSDKEALNNNNNINNNNSKVSDSQPITRSSCSNSQASSLSSLGSGNNNTSAAVRSPTLESDDHIVLNLAPLYSPDSQPASLMSTFKGGSTGANSSEGIASLASPVSPTATAAGMAPSATVLAVSSSTATTITSTSTSTISTAAAALARAPRPTPPNTLNLTAHSSVFPPGAGTRSNTTSPALGVTSKAPPPPPPRWAKPSLSLAQTFTPTEGHDISPSPQLESKRPSLELDTSHTLSSHSSFSNLTESQSLSQGQQAQPQQPRRTPTSQVTSPSTPNSESLSKSVGRSSRRQRHRKESHHYQESDILESPTVYYRSSVTDKQSDYEDIWGTELSTFKPPGAKGPPRSSPFSSPEDISSGSNYHRLRQPDLLERVGTPIVPEPAQSLFLYRRQGGIALSPAGSQSCGNLTPTNSNSSSLVQSPDAGTPTNLVPGAKQGSPFYAEPADAIRQSGLVARRRPRPQGQPQLPRAQRHSDPSAFHQWPSIVGGRVLERIDSSEELPNMSSSADDLAMLRTSRSNGNLIGNAQSNGGLVNGSNKPRAKPVQPPRVRSGKASDNSWAVDSSWEFIGNDDENEHQGDRDCDKGNERDRRFPSLEQQVTSLEDSDNTPTITVQDIIFQRLPELRKLPEVIPVSQSLNKGNGDGSGASTDSARMSAYDNVEGRHSTGSQHFSSHNGSDNEDALTEFSEPWDTSRWEGLLRRSETPDVSSVQVQSNRPDLGTEDEDAVASSMGDEPPRHPGPPSASLMRHTSRSHSRSKSLKDRLDPMISPPRIRAIHARDAGCPGGPIRAYALHLATDKTTTFAQNIDNFIACTKESRETRPQVVMRNMRQFMSGMKNYLVKHGEREFDRQVEKERTKLKANEFLNLDAILEGVMHKLVVRPLKEHLYNLFVEEYTQSGAIQLLADNIQYARTKQLQDLGVRSKIAPPTEKSMETICHFLRRLQEVDSPLEKLENLLTCISAIFNSVKSSNANRGSVTLGADDFLPLFVWVLVQSGLMSAEIEAEYMWGLLHPSLLSGEGGYYLTTLSSAVHVLKSFRSCSEDQSRTAGSGHSLDWASGSFTDFCSVLKIVVPDELHGSIITKTLPVRPNMTTRDVCKIIAHKARITNPQDYGLFKLVDGEETLLSEAECPQDLKGAVSHAGKHCMFAYKRIDAKIAWPRPASPH